MRKLISISLIVLVALVSVSAQKDIKKVSLKDSAGTKHIKIKTTEVKESVIIYLVEITYSNGDKEEISIKSLPHLFGSPEPALRVTRSGVGVLSTKYGDYEKIHASYVRSFFIFKRITLFLDDE